MRTRLLNSLVSSENAAVAPVVALSLFGLIAVGGIAFDYSRMATLDSELQAAADQAALAAASQLDGADDAQDRAQTAANNLIKNFTLFGNDKKGSVVTIKSLDFYAAYDREKDDPTPATTQRDTRFVQVTIDSREAFFALTPIVKMLSSGAMSAQAIAGVGSGICNVPPLMVCASDDFPTSEDAGKGLLLQPGPKSGPWAPGDYGYLDFGNGKSGLKTNLGANNDAASCMSGDSVPTEPGNAASAPKALNTRLDLYDSGVGTCDTSNGDNCPAQNTRKDLVKTEEVTFSNLKATDPKPANPGCGYVGKNSDEKVKVTDFALSDTHPARGFTRDTCHTTGGCDDGNFGDGNWDRTTYFSANHPGDLTAAATWAGKTDATVSRYDVYKWELDNKATRLSAQLLNPSDEAVKKVTGPRVSYTYTNYCAYSQPVNGTIYTSSTTQKDRRVLTVAVVNCSGLNGKGNVKVRKWIDVFLVEASLNRTFPYSTGQSQIYGEIIGIATKPDGSSAFQYYSRNQPYLVK